MVTWEDVPRLGWDASSASPSPPRRNRSRFAPDKLESPNLWLLGGVRSQFVGTLTFRQERLEAKVERVACLAKGERERFK